jgi:type I restriction enzyme S subunit
VNSCPRGWIATTVRELVSVEHGWPFASEYFVDGNEALPVVVAVGNFDYAGGLRFDRTRVKRYAGDYPEKYELSPGDILLIMTCQTAGGEILGVPGRVPDNRTKYLHNQRLGLVRVRRPELLDADFFFQLARSRFFNRQLLESASGSKILHTSPGRIEAVRFFRPPLREQQAIATLLGDLDDKIDSNRRTIDICSGLLDATSSSLALELDSVPLSGLAAPLRDAFDPSHVGAELIDHFSIPAFDAKGLPDRTSGTSVISTKLRVDQPSVLVSRLNPATNRTWFAVPEPGVTAGCSTEFLVLTPKAGVTLGSLWLAVRDEGFRSLLAQRATGTSGSHQRVKAQDALVTEVPDVRRLPAAEAQAADGLLWLMHQRRVESTRLAALRDTLLPELLSGRIRVPEAGEAVESALA